VFERGIIAPRSVATIRAAAAHGRPGIGQKAVSRRHHPTAVQGHRSPDAPRLLMDHIQLLAPTSSGILASGRQNYR